MIDVIITSYNNEDTILQCYNSIPEIINGYSTRIIICDDCSTDNTVEILKTVISGTSIILEKSKNIGVALNRQSGLDLASAKYVMFVDGDDILDKIAPTDHNHDERQDPDLIVLARSIPSRQNKTISIENDLSLISKNSTSIECLINIYNLHDSFLSECWGYI